MTAKCIEAYEDWKANPTEFERLYVHRLSDLHGDTVTMLGLESPGHTVAASSTSGLSWKMPGRVGDSPIVGAGIYADDEAGCAGATGWGEELWKGVASFRTVEAMRRGLTPQAACEETIHQLLRRQPLTREVACVVLALGLDGEVGAATTLGEFPLWICRDGVSECRIFYGMAEG
jgi:isoaspartyl peptidase/L-asparaginase-like protein (Ntn-hydrolase superfamily)